MRMCTWLFSALLVALVSTAAVAQTGGGQATNGFYLGLHGGVTILSDIEVTDDTGTFKTETTTDTGFGVGGFGGYKFNNGIRLELEGSYRRNSADTLEITDDGGIGVALGLGSLSGLKADLDGDVSSFSVMANLWYEHDTGTSWLPYIGGGVGGSWVSADLDVTKVAGADVDPDVNLVDDSDLVFAFQVGAGLGYDFGSGVVLSVDYRYLATVDPSLDLSDNAGRIDAEYQTHNAMIGLRATF